MRVYFTFIFTVLIFISAGCFLAYIECYKLAFLPFVLCFAVRVTESGDGSVNCQCMPEEDHEN